MAKAAPPFFMYEQRGLEPQLEENQMSRRCSGTIHSEGLTCEEVPVTSLAVSKAASTAEIYDNLIRCLHDAHEAGCRQLAIDIPNESIVRELIGDWPTEHQEKRARVFRLVQLFWEVDVYYQP